MRLERGVCTETIIGNKNFNFDICESAICYPWTRRASRTRLNTSSHINRHVQSSCAFVKLKRHWKNGPRHRKEDPDINAASDQLAELPYGHPIIHCSGSVLHIAKTRQGRNEPTIAGKQFAHELPAAVLESKFSSSKQSTAILKPNLQSPLLALNFAATCNILQQCDARHASQTSAVDLAPNASNAMIVVLGNAECLNRARIQDFGELLAEVAVCAAVALRESFPEDPSRVQQHCNPVSYRMFWDVGFATPLILSWTRGSPVSLRPGWVLDCNVLDNGQVKVSRVPS